MEGMEGGVGWEYLRLFGFDHFVGELPNYFYFVSQEVDEVIRVVNVLKLAGDARGGGGGGKGGGVGCRV